MMSVTETVKTFMTALQSGDMETAANVMADDFRFFGWTQQPLNKGQFLAVQSRLLVAMPDFSYNMSDVQKEHGRGATAFIQMTGTHINALDLPLPGFLPIEATGLSASLPQVPVHYTFEGNTLREMSVEEVPGGGLTGLLQQIGNEVPLSPGLASISPGELGMFETSTPNPIRGEQKDTPD